MGVLFSIGANFRLSSSWQMRLRQEGTYQDDQTRIWMVDFI